MRVADVSETQTAARPEEALRMLASLRELLYEAHAAGEAVLRLEPCDLSSIGSEAGLDGDAVGVFRALVRSNAVRLRGRWREGVSGVSAPVYVARLTGQGRGTGHPGPTETRGLADGIGDPRGGR